ncbi:MAG: hypothetical protein Kow002_08510 [Anaerolineales bacterium]
MKKIVSKTAISVLMSIFIIIAACGNPDLTPLPTIHPSAQPLLHTMTIIASTVEGIGATATAYAASITPSSTPTETPTPTYIPDAGKVKKYMNTALEDELRDAMGTEMEVTEVIFGKDGESPYTELTIKMTCNHHGEPECDPVHAFIDLINACKKKNNDAIDYISSQTQWVMIWITTENNRTWATNVNWPDVIAYKNGELSAVEFQNRVGSGRFVP